MGREGAKNVPDRKELRNWKISISREQVFVDDFGYAIELDCVLGYFYLKNESSDTGSLSW